MKWETESGVVQGSGEDGGRRREVGGLSSEQSHTFNGREKTATVSLYRMRV